MNDNSYGTTFGPSTPGAINLISGQTNGVTGNINGTGSVTDRRQRHHLGYRRRRPARRRLLHHHRRAVQHDRQDHRRPAERRGRDLGLLRPAVSISPLPTPTAPPAAPAAPPLLVTADQEGRLHPPPRAVPVLHLHRQSDPRAADLGFQRSATPTPPITSTTCTISTTPSTRATSRRSAS